MAGEHAEGFRIRDLGVGGILDFGRVGVGSEEFALLLESLVEDGDFHRLNPSQTPACGSHFVDELVFDLVKGFEAVDEGCFKAVEFFLRFVRKDDTAAGEAVLKAVLGSDGFAFFRHGSVRVLLRWRARFPLYWTWFFSYFDRRTRISGQEGKSDQSVLQIKKK